MEDPIIIVFGAIKRFVTAQVIDKMICKIHEVNTLYRILLAWHVSHGSIIIMDKKIFQAGGTGYSN